ncbi:MAG TPA: hypothetical protein VFX49_12985 [Chloroflexota bacterium]|nr:hypothetical protein [Chloroflexota bacterium]
MSDRPARVGPRPAPPPERLDTWVVLDLLATTRRWRVNEPFVAGQTDGLARALVACLNAGDPVPHWLRTEIIAFLLEALWERSGSTGDERAELAARWADGARP